MVLAYKLRRMPGWTEKVANRGLRGSLKKNTVFFAVSNFQAVLTV